MQIRRMVTMGCAVGLLGAAPGQARVGVDEEASRPVTGSDSGGGSGTTAGWDEKEGGFVVRSADGDYKLVVGGLLQARFDAVNWDEDFQEDNDITFSVRRARLFFVGNFMGKSNTYYVQLAADAPDVVYDHPDKGANDLKLHDAWIKHEYSESFAMKAGQFKVPFLRQNLTSAGKLQFPERALSSEYWNRVVDRRDVGIEASGAMSQGKVMYAAALVNGDGPNTLNLDDRMGVYGRLSFNPTGDYGYSEGDLDDSDKLASTIGISATYQKDPEAQELTRVNLDGGIKKAGFSLQGEWTWGQFDATGDDASDVNSFYLQGGYFIRPAKAEVVARASRVLFDGDDNDLAEYSAGFNYYWKANRLKWLAAYSYLDDAEFSENHHRFTGQLQLWF
jgi:phosphate-selective porin